MNHGASSSTRGVVGGGVSHNTLDYVTMASTGNAVDFGDLVAASYHHSACSSKITGLWAGGYPSGYTDTIQKITIATTGNASDYGDLTAQKWTMASASNGHGGI